MKNSDKKVMKIEIFVVSLQDKKRRIMKITIINDKKKKEIVTRHFRLEGAYLSLPRWGKHICRGAVRGHPVGCYSPEQLKELSPGEINALIERA